MGKSKARVSGSSCCVALLKYPRFQKLGKTTFVGACGIQMIEATARRIVLRISKPVAYPVQPENSLSCLLLGVAQTLDSNGCEIFVESSVSMSAGRDREKQGRAAV
jgi:hypothetical protein